MNLSYLMILAGSAAVVVSFTTAVFAAEPASGSGQTLVYFGTYTGPNSKGIYVSKLDPATGQLSTPELAAEVSSPSFVALHPSRRFLYAVNEVSNFNGKKTGAVSAFSIDAKSGKLKLLNQQPSGGDGPCHLMVDSTGKNVLVANYGGGSCCLLPIGADGRLGPSTAFDQHRGSSSNRERQSGPHAHGAYFDAGNRFAFVPDLGLDQVLIYRFDPANGSLTANDPAFGSVPPGSGPRHLAFHPSGKYAYVINEMLCTISAFTYDSGRGALEPLQTVSTLPEGQKVLPSYSTAEIEIHPSGKFLYGSNRGHNSLAVFAVDSSTGKLTAIQNQPSGGKTPRGFGIDPSGRYLIAGAQDSDVVASFKIDQDTGRLSMIDQKVQVGSPVCVRFLHLD